MLVVLFVFATLLQSSTTGVREEVKDWFQVAAWVAAVIGGAVAVQKAVSESRANRQLRERTLAEAQENRQQREKDLRWRKAQIGYELVEKMLKDRAAWRAMEMIDWPDVELELAGGDKFRVTPDAIIQALRPVREKCTPEEKRIRDAFDALFYHMSRLEKSVTIELTTLDDVSLPIAYYIEQMAQRRGLFEDYMKAFGHTGALALASRFEFWRGAGIPSSTSGL
ncbi:MAG TPA: hypothetical protein VEK79_07115 [Thermoanaerobaculia bacterium]|nr:hypothetical protein [Thermoanaerobaculia bacterium]